MRPWCLASMDLSAPRALPVEAASAVPRHVLSGSVAVGVGRDTLTPYDAWYVALAEAHGCPLGDADPASRAPVRVRCPQVRPAAAANVGSPCLGG